LGSGLKSKVRRYASTLDFRPDPGATLDFGLELTRAVVPITEFCHPELPEPRLRDFLEREIEHIELVSL